MALKRDVRQAPARQPARPAPTHRLGPERAWLVAALALPLGGALLARMAGWPVAATLAALALLVAAAGAVRLAARRARALPSTPRFDALSPLDFERQVAAWFQERGYRVEHVGGRGDGGVDVRVWQGGRAGIVQCKRYGAAHPVGPAAIRELVGARTLGHADDAWLATTGRLTAGARQLALIERIGLLDAAALGMLQPSRRPWPRTARHPLNSVSHAGMRLAEGDGESS